ncbi:hypothetical protein D3C77_690100 [compost metagenome]
MPFQQRGRLKHITQLRAGRGGCAVLPHNAAGLRREQARGKFQQRCLAAAAAANQAMKATGLQAPVDAVHDGRATGVGVDRPFDVKKGPGRIGNHGSYDA